MVTVCEITERIVWDNFFTDYLCADFLHDWLWGEFQLASGNKTFRLGIFDGETLVGICLVIENTSKRGRYFVVPHGPLIRSLWDRKDYFRELLSYIKNLAEKENVWAIRMGTLLEDSEMNAKNMEGFGFRRAPVFVQPEHELVLNLQLPAEDLLNNMRKTTRYLIRHAETLPVQTKVADAPEDFNNFESLYLSTASRHKFIPYSSEYLRREYEIFNREKRAYVFLATYNSETVAGAFIVVSHKTAFYHHGATNMKYSKIPAGYFLQWEIIKKMKEIGCQYYNFHHVTESEDKNHPWYGLSLFKKGFGGEIRSYLPSRDLMFSPKFLLTLLADQLLIFRRGFAR